MAGRQDDLSDRKKQILKAIVDAHIASGEPVGSKYLTQSPAFSCSSATIRNEMAELENLGYLEQPHTSSGRIPSESGYRFYVDQLLDRYNLTNAEIDDLQQKLRQKRTELDGILSTAVSLAAKLTNHTAISVKPKASRITVRKYEIMRLDDYNVMLIMLVGTEVRTKYISSKYPIPADAATMLAGVLNVKATEITANEFTMPLIMDMERMMGEYDYLVSPVVRSICETISAYSGGDLMIEGLNNLLAYPDTYDMDRLREMITLFEKKDALLDLFSGESQKDQNLKVYIGRENLVKVMDNSTLVFKPILSGGTAVGAVGVIGPTRMNYKRVIAAIENVVKGVTNAIESVHDDRILGNISNGDK